MIDIYNLAFFKKSNQAVDVIGGHQYQMVSIQSL